VPITAVSPTPLGDPVPAPRHDSAGAPVGRRAASAVEPAVAVTVDQRILDALLRCVARWGLGKTTIDDVAREAGCSRATVYRSFPGGKTALVSAAAQREVVELLLEVSGQIAATDDLEARLTMAITSAARFVSRHDPLDFLVRHEPELLLPFLAFDQLDPLLAVASGFVAPQLAPLLPPGLAAEVVEWAARLLISFMFRPVGSMDLSDERHARALVRTYLLPGIAAGLDTFEPNTRPAHLPSRS